MNRQSRTPLSESLRKAMDDLGAEPLAGSGFEDETPEEGFGEDKPTSRSFRQE
jgi:hypothetical protein